MKATPKILLVEDSDPLAAVYQEYLAGGNYTVHREATGAKAKYWIRENSPQLILLDINLPDMSGMDVLRWLKDEDVPAAVVVITAHGSVDVAVETMQLGADDFIEKPIESQRLKTTVNVQLDRYRLRYMVDDLRSTFTREGYHGFIGSSLPMQAVYRIIDAAAPSSATVFITGESGTGKEVCAEAIHKQSPRSKGPFIAINCGAIPNDLMESEIFGHVKGAFTGAATERKGAASRADGGTLFLDEICEMGADQQTKLLRFIQTGTFQKVGGSKSEKVDIRFICATNKDPMEEVVAGRFREDLYYRLHVVPIYLPALRERGEDIIAIATSYLRKYSSEEGKGFESFSNEVSIILRSYDWPGNVRQLQNVVRNIVVLHDGDEVQRSQLPPPIMDSMSDTATLSVAEVDAIPVESVTADDREIRPLAEVEREVIEHAIAVCGGNIPKAAGLLHVSPSTIYRKKQAWDE